MKKLFLAILTLIAMSLPMTALAAVNGGVSTWGGVSGVDFLSQDTAHVAYAPGFQLDTAQYATMGTWGGQAAVQQGVNYLNGPVTLVDTHTGASANSPWYGVSRASAGSSTNVSVPDVSVNMSNSIDLLTIRNGSASGSSSIFFIKY